MPERAARLYDCRDRERHAPLVLRETRVPPVQARARDVALRILEQRYGPPASRVPTDGALFGFQRDAVARARAIVARRGGVLIADSVGLGKTHVALALLDQLAGSAGRATVVAPAGLRSHWLGAARDATRIEFLSYAALSRGRVGVEPCDVVVFDEAHALRNPGTRRYRAARILVRDARVVLLTATPVNNSVWDLYHLLRLFSGDRDYVDAGVASLRSAFEEAEAAALLGAAPSLQPVLRSVMIRRTRPLLRDLARDGEPAGPAFMFPAHEPPAPVRYRLGPPGCDPIAVIGPTLLELGFPAHADISAPHLRSDASSTLMRMGLLKRLESSVCAFARSIDAYRSLLDRCIDGVARGLLVRARDDADLDRGPQLRLDELLCAPLPAHVDVDIHRACLVRERDALHRMEVALAPAVAQDGKVEALLALLDGPLRDRKVVVFTQFRDTARYLHERLSRRFRVALVDGAVARLGAEMTDRASVVRGFAPRSNRAPTPPPREAIDVLVATDVLAEGFDLQDADVVISFDLPWNPVRIIQRVGRIDRIGSPHPRIASYHFLPGDLERYLGLLDRITRKARAIDASVGSDVPLLHADLARALERRDPEALSRIERQDSEWFELDERLRALLDRHGEGPNTPDPGNLAVAPVRVAATPAGEDGRDADRPAGPSGLVAAKVGNRFEWVAIRHGRAVADERICGRLLEAALSAAGCEEAAPVPVSRAELSALLEAARPVLARRAATASTAALLPSGGEAARIGRHLLSLAARVPGGPDGRLCSRIERGLARLANASPDRLVGLRALDAFAHRAGPLIALLDAIDALETDPDRAPKGVWAAPAGEVVRLIAVLVERPYRR